MAGVLLSWVMVHPLETVAVLAALSIGVGLTLVPRPHVLTGSNHPRC